MAQLEEEERFGHRIESRCRPAAMHHRALSGFIGAYTDALHVIAYSDGEVRRQFNVCFRARLVGGVLAVSDESHEVRWFTPEEVVGLSMHHTQRLRVEHALGRGEPHAG